MKNYDLLKTNFQDNTNIVLTQESTQTFLVLEPSNDDNYIQSIKIDYQYGDKIYINEILFSNENKTYTFGGIDNSLKEVIPMSLLIRNAVNNGETSIKITVQLSKEILTYNIRILSKIDSKFSINVYKSSKSIYEDLSSCMLIRTNPLLSGNIKFIVDEKQNIFIDTFKVSDILSKKEYRKQQVSANGNLSDDIRKVFYNIPSSELFKINSYDTLDISTPKQDLKDQYDTEYSYGARMLKDELYSQSFSMLAPLWLNKTMPDYFVIFKVPGVFNEETYSSKNTSNLLNNFITNGEIIKTWNLNNNFPLGKYLNSHLEELKKYDGNVFVSMDENESNKWSGISVNNGLIAQLSEYPYELNT
ncbi:MAG: hypothetical protein RSC92_05480, partial [Clostridia bacterium]